MSLHMANPRRGKPPFKKGSPFKRPGSYDSKECTWLSPCLNEFNKIDEKSVLSDVENTGAVNKIEQRLDVMELVLSWYNDLLGSVDIEMINQLYSDSQRIQCIPKDVSAMLGEMRNKYDEIHLRRIPDLLKMNDYYMNLLTKLKAPINRAIFTTDTNDPININETDGTTSQMLMALFINDKLKYKGMSLLAMMRTANLHLLQFIRRITSSSTAGATAGECPDTGDEMDAISYALPEDKFYAIYKCLDNSGYRIVRFKLSGGTATDMTLESHVPYNMNNSLVVLYSNQSMVSYGGDGSVADPKTKSRKTSRAKLDDNNNKTKNKTKNKNKKTTPQTKKN